MCRIRRTSITNSRNRMGCENFGSLSSHQNFLFPLLEGCHNCLFRILLYLFASSIIFSHCLQVSYPSTSNACLICTQIRQLCTCALPLSGISGVGFSLRKHQLMRRPIQLNSKQMSCTFGCKLKTFRRDLKAFPAWLVSPCSFVVFFGGIFILHVL